MEVFIDLTQEELRFVEAYAKAHALTLEIAFKAALFEKIRAENERVPADNTSEDFSATGRNTGTGCKRKYQLPEGPWLSNTLVGGIRSEENDEVDRENA